MNRLRKVLIVNTADVGGGAERIATTLLDGFEALGTETWLAVGARSTEDHRVLLLFENRFIDHTPYVQASWLDALDRKRASDRRRGREDFNHPYTRHLLEISGDPRPDLVLCVNLHGGWFDLEELASFSTQVPTVLRLADSWLFTGHCAIPGACDRWIRGCGRCPDLDRPPAIQRDATRANLRRKRRIYQRSRAAVVAPSSWMLRRAERSVLAPAIWTSRVIPNGVDLDVFRPSRGSDDGDVRAELDVPDGVPLLVTVQNLGAANPTKDWPTLRAAVASLARPTRLVVLGGTDRRDERLGDTVCTHLPREPDPTRVARLLRAADLYVHAAAEESFCLAAAEALACGTPVVAAAGGGIAEVVEQGVTGQLVPRGDSAGLAAAIDELVRDRDRRNVLARAANSAAVRRFDRRRMVADMHGWCEEVADRWHRERPMPG